MKTIFSILAFCLIAAATYGQTKQEVLTAFEKQIKEVVIYAPTYHEFQEIAERILDILDQTQIMYSFRTRFVQSETQEIKYKVHPSELKDFFKQLKNTKTYIQA
jgi:hypothetical protein